MIASLMGRKVKYREFAAALNACGVPCKVSDLDNAVGAKAKPFEPGMAMDTVRVREALAKLKAEHFPELQIDVFFEREVSVEIAGNDFESGQCGHLSCGGVALLEGPSPPGVD